MDEDDWFFILRLIKYGRYFDRSQLRNDRFHFVCNKVLPIKENRQCQKKLSFNDYVCFLNPFQRIFLQRCQERSWSGFCPTLHAPTQASQMLWKCPINNWRINFTDKNNHDDQCLLEQETVPPTFGESVLRAANTICDPSKAWTAKEEPVAPPKLN